MQIIQFLKNNRLKIVSIRALMADFLMGLAGGVSFFFWGNIHGGGDIFLMVACALAMGGHIALLIWGKGGPKAGTSQEKVAGPLPKLWRRTLTPWHYPLDWGFFNFCVTGLLYAIAGIFSSNFPLALNGILTASASALGWLWPQNRPIFGRNVMQVTAVTYATSSVVSFFAAWVAHSVCIALASCLYITVNAILYTVRKGNQSAYTLAQGG